MLVIDFSSRNRKNIEKTKLEKMWLTSDTKRGTPFTAVHYHVPEPNGHSGRNLPGETCHQDQRCRTSTARYSTWTIRRQLVCSVTRLTSPSCNNSCMRGELHGNSRIYSSNTNHKNRSRDIGILKP